LYSMRSFALSRNVSTQDTDISAMHHTMLPLCALCVAAVVYFNHRVILTFF